WRSTAPRRHSGSGTCHGPVGEIRRSWKLRAGRPCQGRRVPVGRTSRSADSAWERTVPRCYGQLISDVLGASEWFDVWRAGYRWRDCCRAAFLRSGDGARLRVLTRSSVAPAGYVQRARYEAGGIDALADL